MTDKPTDGAFMAACTMGRERPELQNSTAWGTDECMVAAHIIDREAVVPAVQDLAKSLDLVLTAYSFGQIDITEEKPRAEMRKWAEGASKALQPVRHLIEESGE